MDSTIQRRRFKMVGYGKVALRSVAVEAELQNLLCEVTIRQVYSNLEMIDIEAVYTLPLPLDAVLLDLTIKTRARELKGIVVEKSKAEAQYEEAITDGDTAIILEQISPGLYTVNVGILQPGESYEVSFRYAELLKWRGDSLRFFLPTTIAPKYGDPGMAGIAPHQTPEYDLLAENRFSITVSIFGELAQASISSPSHNITFKKLDTKTCISITGGEALMDRDFILTINMENGKKNFAHLERDIDGYTVLAFFNPEFPAVPGKTPRCITIIIDCSGSMAGDSTTQARQALLEILGFLRPGDFFNILQFGNSQRTLFHAPVPVNTANLAEAENLLNVLKADMGGTEVGAAVMAAINGDFPQSMVKDFLLITDGEVWNWEEVVSNATRSGFRFFTVGVGSSVAEPFVRTLADATGGACEQVSPNEAMAEKIVRHFRRIYSPRAENVAIQWPGPVDKTLPERIDAIHEGDTVYVFGRFKELPQGDVVLSARLDNGDAFSQTVTLRANENGLPDTETGLPGATARMAAAYEMKELKDPEKISELGVRYQLMSPYTNYLAIDLKAADEKARDLPALRKVPQCLAAGWGGVGSVRLRSGSAGGPILRERAINSAPPDFDSGSISCSPRKRMGEEPGMLGYLDYDEPTFIRRKVDDYDGPSFIRQRRVSRSNKGDQSFSRRDKTGLFGGLRIFGSDDTPPPFLRKTRIVAEPIPKRNALIQKLNRLHAWPFVFGDMVQSICDLACEELSNEMSELLRELRNSGVDEKSTAVIFLYLLSREESIEKMLKRSTKRILLKAYKQYPGVTDSIQRRIRTAVTSYLRRH